MDKLLTIEEVAGLLRIPIHTVRYWRATGKGPRAVRLGKHLVYRETDVRAWLDEQFAAADADRAS